MTLRLTINVVGSRCNWTSFFFLCWNFSSTWKLKIGSKLSLVALQRAVEKTYWFLSHFNASCGMSGCSADECGKKKRKCTIFCAIGKVYGHLAGDMYLLLSEHVIAFSLWADFFVPSHFSPLIWWSSGTAVARRLAKNQRLNIFKQLCWNETVRNGHLNRAQWCAANAASIIISTIWAQDDHHDNDVKKYHV